MAKILLVGGGGRENAIAWKLSLSSKVSKILINNTLTYVAKFDYTRRVTYSIIITFMISVKIFFYLRVCIFELITR